VRERFQFTRMQLVIYLIVVSATAAAYTQSNCACAAQKPESKLMFTSSDTQLVQAFNWAKRQAMAYVQDGSDPVGLWYETGLPGRTRFSMRDTSHQSMGAQALGLSAYTHNMLYHFAENISDAKDWCSYWGIDRWGRPARVDYKNDDEFWYDLPANFDVLDASYRMFLWTGDLSYVNDPVFLNFYSHTVDDYVERWQLGPDHVMQRKRWLNIHGTFDPHDNMQTARGIPGYREGPRDYIVGVDLLATEYQALEDYSYIEAYNGDADRAAAYQKKAEMMKGFINTTWWDANGGRFYSLLDKNYQLAPADPQTATHANNVELLYRGAADDGPKLDGALESLLETIKLNPSSQVEGESHYPEVLYRYGKPAIAYQEIMDLTHLGRSRQEYPEVSYSVIGAMVTGLMGINLEAPAPFEAWTSGNYTEIVVTTYPGLTAQTSWAELRDLPIRTNLVAVRQEGTHKTTLTNESGPSLIWKPMFAGTYETLTVNGKPMRATPGELTQHRAVSWVRLPVGAGNSVTVETPATRLSSAPLRTSPPASVERQAR
jgi:hypothetical protein